jgi:Ser/Thr protein kinase RdoA (MazF antagonist)
MTLFKSQHLKARAARAAAASSASRDHQMLSANDIEEPLTGGHLTRSVVRVANSVRRPSKDSSAFVARLLTHLEGRHASWAPRYLGQDELARDVLTYVPGWVPAKWRRFEDAQIRGAALLIAQLHAATRGTLLAAPHAVVCHHDAGPHNFVFRGNTPIALIDFDMAAPGEALEDLGYMAWAWCISSKPERRPVAAQARQLCVLAEAYGLHAKERAGLVEAALAAQAKNVRFWAQALAIPERTSCSADMIVERIAWSRRELAYLTAHGDELAAAL